MAKEKFYAVAVGGETGIYTDWPSAERQVKGVAGAKYKSFSTEAEAKAFLENPVYNKKTVGAKKQKAVSRAAKPPLADNAVLIYTDGGSINNPGPGGYGVVIEMDGDRRELSGGFRLTTNNRMEMTAALVALHEVMECGRPVCLHSDSSYLVNGITRGWAKGWRKRGWKKSDGQPALNSDLWGRLLELVEGMDVQFYWVKGHAGNPLNERCDRLAVAAAKGNPQAVDTEYEKSVA